MGWRECLARSVDEIGPMPRGRYLPRPEPAQEWVSGVQLIEPGYLSAAIRRARPVAQDGPRDRDVRVAVSRMTRQYVASLTCVALAGLAQGMGIDLSPTRVSALIRYNVPYAVTVDTEPLFCKERPVDEPAIETRAQLREYVWTNLYARNLRELFRAATALVRVPERLLWTNAAEWVAIVLDSAVEYLPPERADVFAQECQALLNADTLPGFDANPLRGLVEWVPFDGEEIQTRHLCCLVYLHSDRQGRLCQNCPLLPLPDRAALVRERRGVGMTGPGGPAERRSMEIGVRRLAITRESARSRPDG
ncbi:IucA/IucC family C-terminal-domain containing protein [Actinocrispum sp. NPDC049592]|uniref:IucA/IucC family C-terminal-domain containing protein n=1 Tax=Actinocrispum sp. NPDC049592 TaxID=3154835 RepID=UPI003434B10F